MSNVPAWISAMLNVFFGIWAKIRGDKAHSIQTKLVAIEEAREKDRQGERRKAVLVVSVCQDPKVRGLGYYKLRIANTGQAQARGVRVTVKGLPFEQHADGVENPGKPDTLGPGSSCEYWVKASVKPPFNGEIAWDDDSGVRSSVDFSFSG